MEKKEAEEYFISCGIDPKRAKESTTNSKLTEALLSTLKQAQSYEGTDLKSIVNLLYTLASTLSPEASIHRNTVVSYIVTGKLDKLKLEHAINYLKKLGGDTLDIPTFEKEAGIGITITKEDIKREVSIYLENIKGELEEQKYAYPINNILATLREKIKFASPKDVKEEVDAQLLSLLGPKVNDGKKSVPKKLSVPKPEKNAANEPAIKELITFPDPRENKQRTPELLEAHLKATEGKVVCRFPPEPNGYLHVGHAKSMNLNFSYPKKSGGYTYLRYDDTNPEAEKLEYIQSIEEDVAWLGHKPWKITYSSDYFPQLYDFAIQLIKSGKAYVDHQTPDEIKEYREKKMESPWRNRPIEESLKLFEDMKNGKFEEGKATLRMKMDMQSDNTVMRDLIAYRIKYTPHPHVGDKWCIYPSYDYTHCIIDSLENITHSLCTLEFEVRRESYNRLLDDLGIYKPLVWEYSRLNITNTVLSKRKLIKLVTGGYVSGWDDPRMPTIKGFRRRGFTPDSINDFCDRIGITRNENFINYKLLEQCVREDLEKKANRALGVLEPLKVEITNWEGGVKLISAPLHPKDASRGKREVPISKIIYIEKQDFRLEDIKGYKRLAPGQEVGLLHAGYTIKCTDVIKDAAGNVSELKVTVNTSPTSKPRGFINWVAEPSPGQEPHKVDVRLYDVLFKSEQPNTSENWLDDLNPNSLVITTCYVEPALANSKVGDSYQFERIGFFCVDVDSTSEKNVWNRIVTLKEAKWEETPK